jgi:hypothetical protein
MYSENENVYIQMYDQIYIHISKEPIFYVATQFEYYKIRIYQGCLSM